MLPDQVQRLSAVQSTLGVRNWGTVWIADDAAGHYQSLPKDNCMIRAFKQRHGKIFILLLVGTFLLGGCLPGLHKASLEMIDRAEAQWQQAPAQDYEITVEVNRPDDRRRTTVIVTQGQIVQGEVSYWNSVDKRWDEPYALNEEQSFPFTIPGLFEMVRGELKNSGRVDIRVRMKDELSFPWHIVLGPVMRDGQAVSGTEAAITVEQYTPRE